MAFPLLWLSIIMVSSFDMETDKIIFVGLPKSGTTSFTEMLTNQLHMKCAHYASHWSSNECRQVQDKFPFPAVTLSSGITWPEVKEHRGWCPYGELVQLAMAEHRAPFYYLFDQLKYHALTQYDCDACSSGMMPQVDALPEIVAAYPDAYFVHNTRNIDAHVKSFINWEQLTTSLKRTGHLDKYPGQNQTNSLSQNVKVFIQHCQDHVRDTFNKVTIDAAKVNSTKILKYIEIPLEAENGLQQFVNFLGLNHTAIHMPHSNHNKHKKRSVEGM